MTSKLPKRRRPSQAVRSGGIGDQLPGGATRRTARGGQAPVALPRAWVTNTSVLSLVDDVALRLRLGVQPHELLVEWTIVDPHLAHRSWPTYWLRIWGIDLASVIDPITIGPVFTLASPPGSPTHARRLLLLEAEVHWQDSPVYARFRYRRGWPEVKLSIEGIEHQRSRYDVQMAQRGLALARGMAPRGRPPRDREPELDRLADLARRWARQKHRALDDVQWQHLEATDMRAPRTLERAAARLSIHIDDILKRAHEREA